MARFAEARFEALRDMVVPDVREKTPARVLGRGAYGEVVEMTLFGTRVAAKKMYPIFFTANPEEINSEVTRFKNECTRMSKLRHPNIVQFLGVHFEPGSHIPILIMEFLPMSLARYLTDYQEIDCSIKNSILLDVSLGLLFLHKQTPPIAHRDLTANNVLLTSGLQAKIADLGVSRTVEADVHKHFVLSKCPGNMYYMPPEAICQGVFKEDIENVDKLDIFSFGVLIIHTYSQVWPTFTPAFDSNNIPLTEVQRREQYIKEISDVAMKTLAESCLHNIPTRRPHTTEVVETLKIVCSKVPPLGTMMEKELQLKTQNEAIMRDLESKNSSLNVLEAALSQEKAKVIELVDQISNEQDKMKKLALKHMEECKLNEGIVRSLETTVEEKRETIQMLQARLDDKEKEILLLRANQLKSNASGQQGVVSLPPTPTVSVGGSVLRDCRDYFHSSRYEFPKKLAMLRREHCWEIPLVCAGKQIRQISSQTNEGNIAAIDFGTSSCSLAFGVQGLKTIINLPLHGPLCREFTAILLSKSGDKMDIDSFGQKAQEGYSHLPNKSLNQFIYFECFKMELWKNLLCLETTICDSQGHEYYLVEVIAFVLKHIKDTFQKFLKTAPFRKSDGITPLSCVDFDWMITVPAKWSASSKQFMKKAALLAGLCSDRLEGVDSFTNPAPGKLFSVPHTIRNVKSVTLVLEPECVGIFCQEMNQTSRAAYSDIQTVPSTINRYMVVDIGEKTVDIAVCHVDPRKSIDSITPPTGDSFGGTRVNQAFLDFLAKMVKDPNFESFKKQKGCRSAISNLEYEFERAKKHFADDGYNKKPNKTINIVLQNKILEFYKDEVIENGIKELNDDRVTFEEDGDTISMEYSYFMELIEDILDGIWESTKYAIEFARCEIDTIYLVGGFGGSRLIYEMLKEKVHATFPTMKASFVVPRKRFFAISEGAVLFGRNPSKIRRRVSDAHYGTNACVLFNDSIHDTAHEAIGDDGVRVCQDVFLRFVLKGQIIDNSEVFTETFYPVSSTSTEIYISFFSTKDDDVYYVCDGTDKLNKKIKLIGRIRVDVPECGRPREQREIKVEMIFFHTEIKATSIYVPTGEKTNIELDFLSNLEIDNKSN